MFSKLLNSRHFQRIRRSDIFETLIHSQNYLIAQMVTTGLAFIAIPIFTRLFTQEDYGVISVYNAFLAIAVIVFSGNIYSSIARYYFEKKSDFNEFLGTTFVLTLLFFSVGTTIFFLFYDIFSSSMKLPGILPFLLIFSSLFAISHSFYFQILISQKRSLESAIINILKGSFSLFLAILLILVLEENRYLGKIWGYLLVSFIFSLYFFIKILNHSKLSFKKDHIKFVLYYSVPLIPYTLSSTILAFFDRILINDVVNASSAGVYTLGYNVAAILSIVISATQAALLPDFFAFLNDKQYSRIDALVKKVFSVIVFAAFGLILFGREIVIILADVKFHEGLVVVPIVVIGWVFFGMFSVYIRYISYSKKTIYSSLVMIISGLSNIVLNIIFIPIYGYIAAAYTTAISYFILFLLTWCVPKFILKLKLTPIWILWKPTLLLFLFIGISSILTFGISNIFLLFGLKVILILVFFISLFYHEIKLLKAI